MVGKQRRGKNVWKNKSDQKSGGKLKVNKKVMGNYMGANKRWKTNIGQISGGKPK